MTGHELSGHFMALDILCFRWQQLNHELFLISLILGGAL